jgi:hypothetical protein
LFLLLLEQPRNESAAAHLAGRTSSTYSGVYHPFFKKKEH